MNLLLAGLDQSTPTPHEIVSQVLAKIGELAFEGHTISTLRLLSNWDECFQLLGTELSRNWDAIVCIASKDCEAIAVERIAINEADVSIKDGRGRRPRSKSIVAGGEPGYWSGLPYRELSIRLSEAKLEAASSHSAGKGMSNYLFYRMMDTLAQSGRKTCAGLIHLPNTGFGVDQAKRFARVLLSCLDENARSESRLQINLKQLQVRSGLRSPAS